MARSDERNVRRCLSDYVRPILQRPVTHIHAPLARNANFRIDSPVMSMLPIFHGKPFEDPYKHIDELRQECEIDELDLGVFLIVVLNRFYIIIFISPHFV